MPKVARACRFNALRQTFGKSYRLLKTDDFSSVFALRRRIFLDALCIYSIKNNQSHSRLGVVVSKKCARRAHDRNYMKRRLREWFRLNQHHLPHKDWVIQVRRAFGRHDFPDLEQKLYSLYRHSE